MTMKIVADSSANLHSFDGVPFASVPLKIVTDETEYVDDASLDTVAMMAALDEYKGRTGTSCPNVGDWLEAFGDAEGIFTVAITGSLSGSYNASVQAKEVYEEQYPGRKVCCLDSLSTGPEMVLIVEKLRELIQQGLGFEEIEAAIRTYMQTTHLLFMLESVANLAKNGRISPLIAKAVGFLNIRIVGKASEQGTLQQLHKARGGKKGLEAMMREMIENGFDGGKVRIAHSNNAAIAQDMKEAILNVYPNCDVQVIPCGGLCCYYAENGGMLLGFEG